MFPGASTSNVPGRLTPSAVVGTRGRVERTDGAAEAPRRTSAVPAGESNDPAGHGPCGVISWWWGE